jgi:uncharacterized membrane protein YfcA
VFETDLPVHLVVPAVALAAFLKGITGLGFSTICLALLASVVDLRLAIPMIIIPSLSSNVLVMVQAGEFRATLIRFKWLYVAAIPGLGLGLLMLSSAAPRELGGALGFVLVLYAVFALINPSFRIASPWAERLAAPTGFMTGIINGATGSQVMPALPFLMSLGLGRDALVQAINISFTLGSLVMLGGLARLGFLDWKLLGLSALGIIPVWLGIKLGSWVRVRLPESWFRIGVLIMLIGLGSNLMWSVLS